MLKNPCKNSRTFSSNLFLDLGGSTEKVEHAYPFILYFLKTSFDQF